MFFFGFYRLRGDKYCDLLKFLCLVMNFIFCLILILLLEININILYFLRLLILDIFGFLLDSLINKENVDNSFKKIKIKMSKLVIIGMKFFFNFLLLRYFV